MPAGINHVAVGEGRPVLVLHGGGLDHRHMRDAVEPVFEGLEGWRRIYPDLPGCGGSTGFDHVRSQDDVLAEVAAFADAAGDGRPLAVIGESRGSYIARGLVYTRPDLVAGLALVVPGGLSDAALPAPMTLVRDRDPHLLDRLDPAVRARAERLVVQTADLAERIARTKVPAAALHDPALEARVRDRFTFSFHESMSHTVFDRPSLIVAGRQDSVAGFADAVEMLGCYPRATLAVLDCAGHSPGWERPDLFLSLVRDWLARMETT